MGVGGFALKRNLPTFPLEGAGEASHRFSTHGSYEEKFTDPHGIDRLVK